MSQTERARRTLREAVEELVAVEDTPNVEAWREAVAKVNRAQEALNSATAQEARDNALPYEPPRRGDAMYL